MPLTSLCSAFSLGYLCYRAIFSVTQLNPEQIPAGIKLTLNRAGIKGNERANEGRRPDLYLNNRALLLHH